MSALDYLASALICPAGLLYLCLLNDRWRVPAAARWLLLALSGPFSVWVAQTLSPQPVIARVAVIWAVPLALFWVLSAVRDARFLFAAASGFLFTYLSTNVCAMAALYLPIHRVLLRLALDGLLLLAAGRFFRPAFLRVAHTMKQGWLALSLMPISLSSIFFCLLMVPDYLARYVLPHVQGFTYLLALLTLIFYLASFYFFQKLGAWQEQEVDRAVLTAQVSALSGRESGEEQRRILRHDLRHYLHILTACLRAGDEQSALRALEALDESVTSAGLAGKEAGTGGT